jgi:hypothetical protein
MESIENIDSKKIKKEFDGKEIAYFHQSQTFDGFDKYGAKSHLYDIQIVIHEDGDYVFYSYHKEKWFSANDDEDYSLTTKIKLSEVNKRNLYKFPKIIIDSDLKHEYKKKIKSITKKSI